MISGTILGIDASKFTLDEKGWYKEKEAWRNIPRAVVKSWTGNHYMKVGL